MITTLDLVIKHWLKFILLMYSILAIAILLADIPTAANWSLFTFIGDNWELVAPLAFVQGVFFAFIFRRMFYNGGGDHSLFRVILFPLFVLGATPLAWVVLAIASLVKMKNGDLVFEPTHRYTSGRSHWNEKREKIRAKRARRKTAPKHGTLRYKIYLAIYNWTR